MDMRKDTEYVFYGGFLVWYCNYIQTILLLGCMLFHIIIVVVESGGCIILSFFATVLSSLMYVVYVDWSRPGEKI